MATTGFHELPELPYGYASLEPFMDEATMVVHHDKHHAGYTRNFNAALTAIQAAGGEGAKICTMSPENILRQLNTLPITPEQRTPLRNHGGGYWNHGMFWSVMAPPKERQEHPTGHLSTAMANTFGSLDAFKKEFSKVGAGVFGSGWAWLVAEGPQENPTLKVVSTANQDSPFTVGQFPLLVVDVWEHAYYLRYQNRRPDFLEAWWQLVNWKTVDDRYKEYTGKN